MTDSRPEQQASAERAVPAVTSGRPPNASPAVGSSSPNTPGGVIACNVLGAIFLLAGLYLLVIAPGNPMADDLTDSVAALRVVNFQRLAVGQALTVAGAVFLAAAWRPRR